MNPNLFCGADTLERYEIMRLVEPVVLDTEMIERGDGPLFTSIYDSKYLKDGKSKPTKIKTDAEIVDDIFRDKLKPKSKTVKKSGLPLVINHKSKKDSPIVHRSDVDTQNVSEVMFIMSLFK